MTLRFIGSVLCTIALLNSFCIITPVEQNDENSALAFDGVKSVVDISSIGRISSDAVSIAAWVNPEDIDGYRAILCRGTSDNRFGICLGISDGMIWAGGNSGAGWRNITVSSLDKYQWTHIAAVYDSKEKTIQIYKNGILELTAKNCQFLADTAGCRTTIGRNHIERMQYFHGNIDNVAIWNRVITKNEVDLAMKNSLQKDSPGLFAYFTFHENTGNVTTDQTSKRFKGTLGDGTESSAPEWVRITR